MKEKLKEWSKKWWFWVIIGVLVIGIIGNLTGEKNTEKPIQDTQPINENSNQYTQPITYTLIGENLGTFGKIITLNANSDMPVTKYLYKLPEGNYIVTTTYDKMASFFIVKDKIVNNGDEKYPEELDYVGEGYLLTNGDDDFNGRAKKSVEISIAIDESISLVGKETFTFEKK